MAAGSHPIPEGRYVTTDGGLSIHYHEAGSGEPIVFLHGSGPGASGYSNFKGNYPVFAANGYRAIVPDLPGFGLSSKPDTNYVLDFFVEAVDGLVSKLGLGQCTLLGNSLGGAIALKYTLDHPNVVSRLILMAPGGIEELPAYLQMEGIRKMIELFSAGPMDTDSMRRLLTLQLYDSVAHHGGVAGRARRRMRDAAAHRALDDARAEHGRAPRRNPLPGARLLGYQRSFQSGGRRDEDSRAMPPGALHAAQPMRPLGNGRAPRPVQPHLPGLSPQRLSAQSGKHNAQCALVIRNWAPLMNRDSSEIRNSTRFATSFGSQKREVGSAS